MLGLLAGVYITGGYWYYKELEPVDPLEKASVVVWPMMEALRLSIAFLDYSARKAAERQQ